MVRGRLFAIDTYPNNITVPKYIGVIGKLWESSVRFKLIRVLLAELEAAPVAPQEDGWYSQL